MKMVYSIHHISKRKRFHARLEEYPSKKFWIRVLDKLLIFIAVIGPLMTLPQIIKIYFYQSGGDISVFSWMAMAILDIPWIVYGLVHKEKQITIAYILWFIVNLIVAVGGIMYS